jgi:hypothetical protein
MVHAGPDCARPIAAGMVARRMEMKNVLAVRMNVGAEATTAHRRPSSYLRPNRSTCAMP